MSEVSEAEASLVRAHREAGRLAVALVTDPFDARTMTQLECYLPQAREAVRLAQGIGERGPALRRRIVELSQVAVDGRPRGGAS